MTILRVFIFTLIASISVSCSDITEYEIDLSEIPCIDIQEFQEDEILCIKVNNSNIYFSNLTEHIIYYLVVEQETSTLIDLDPDYTTWHSISGGETATVPYEDIIGYKDSATEAWIIWVLGDNESSGFVTISL